MSANRARFGPSAAKSRRTRPGAASACGAALFDLPFGPSAHPPPGRPDPAVLAHDARHALARGAHAGPLQLGEDLRRPVDPAAGGARLGDRPRELPVAQVALARPARAPRAAAPAGYLRRGAHPRYAPAPLVEQDGREPRLLRPGPCSCPPAKKALAFESISLSRPSLSFSRPSRRRSSAVSKGPASASGAYLAGDLRVGGPPLLQSRTARCLNSAVSFGRDPPMIRPRSSATAMAPKRNSTCQRIRGRYRPPRRARSAESGPAPAWREAKTKDAARKLLGRSGNSGLKGPKANKEGAPARAGAPDTNDARAPGRPEPAAPSA